MAFFRFGGVEDEERIAKIIRETYEEQLATINGDACFEDVAAERIIQAMVSQERTDG